MHKRLLTDNELYLASASQFNDPYDFSLPFKYKNSDLTPENLFLKLREVGMREFPKLSEAELHQKSYQRQMSGVFESGDYWKEMHPGFVECYILNLGFFH